MSLGGALAQAFVRLRVDSSQVAADTSKGIKEGAATGDAESAGENAGAGFSKGFNKAFKVAMVGALAIAAIGAASLKSGIDFQATMTKIQTQAGASKAQVQQLTGAVLKLAPSTEQGPQQLAEALYHLKSVGLDNVDAMKALKVASDLAAVGGANLEETTNAIAAAWRSGIKGAQNFGQAAATVNAIIGAGNMKMQDFVSAMSTGVLSSATTFGVSLKSVGSAMALMTDEGVPAQLAATRLRMSLSLLGAPSAAAEKQLKSIGLTGLDLANIMRSPAGITGAIAELKAHLVSAGLTASQQAALLSRAFGGGQSSSAILTMINNLGTLEQKEKQITRGMSAYGPAVADQRQTVQAQLDILRSSLETIGVRMGLALLSPFTKFVKFLSADVIPGAIRFGGILGGLFKSPYVQAFLASLVTAMVTIKTIITVTKLWAAAQALVTAAMDANPIGIAIVAVAALAAGIAVLWERSATFRKIVEGAFRAVQHAAAAVVNWVKGHWVLLAAILLAPFAPIIAAGYMLYKLVGIVEHVFDGIKHAITAGFDSWWKSHGQEIEQIWKTAWNDIKAIFDVVWGPIITSVKTGWNLLVSIIRPGLALLGEWFKISWGLVTAVTRASWDVISGVVKAAWAIVSGVVKIAAAYIELTVKTAWDIVVGIFNVTLDLLTGKWGKAWQDIRNTVTQVLNAVKGFLSSAWNDIKSTAAAAWNALIGGVKSAGSDLIGYVKRIPGMILAALGDVGKLLWNAGVSIIKGLIGGIGSMIGSVGHAIGSVASTIKSFLPFSPAKRGPLSGRGDPYYSGLSIGSKIAAGIAATAGKVKAAIGGTLSSMKAELAKATAEQGLGKTQISSLTGHVDKLQGERAKEESQIKALIAARQKEYAEDRKGSKALRAEQEKQIKTLQKLRASQETQVKATEAVIKNLRSEMSKLKSEVTKLKEAIAKATKAAAKAAASSNSSSSSGSSGSSSGSASSTPDWAAFNTWLDDTSSGASGGSWQGNPGPLGGFGVSGVGLPAGPRPVGQWGGPPPWMGGDGGELNALLIGRLDELISAAHEQPWRTAAGLNAAMNGVAAHAVVKGNW